MVSDGKVNFLEAVLEEQISGFNQRRKANKKRAFLFRLSIIICGLLTTVLIGIHSVSPTIQPFITDIALLFSALLTALGAIDAFFDHRALWIRYTTTSNELKTLRSKLRYLLADGKENIDDTQIDSLFEGFHKILNETNSEWLKLRKETETKIQAK
jgi:hypothetical protein